VQNSIRPPPWFLSTETSPAEAGYWQGRGLLNRDPLDLIERDGVVGPVVQLGGARAFVCRHCLRVFERAAGFEIRGDAGRAEHMAAELDLEARFGRAPSDHLIGIDTVHGIFRQPAGLAGGRAEEGGFAVVADAGRGEILINEGLELVMRRHFVALAPFLMQPHHQRLPAG
jgi:hypothetical protein